MEERGREITKLGNKPTLIKDLPPILKAEVEEFLKDPNLIHYLS